METHQYLLILIIDLLSFYLKKTNSRPNFHFTLGFHQTYTNGTSSTPMDPLPIEFLERLWRHCFLVGYARFNDQRVRSNILRFSRTNQSLKRKFFFLFAFFVQKTKTIPLGFLNSIDCYKFKPFNFKYTFKFLITFFFLLSFWNCITFLKLKNIQQNKTG